MKNKKEYCQWHEVLETPAECSMNPTIAKPQHSEACLEADQGVGKNEGFTCIDSCLDKAQAKRVSVSEHTPTPWKVGKGHRIEYETPGGGCVVVVDEHSISGLGVDSYIVRAVNCHEALVNMIKRLTEFYVQDTEIELMRDIRKLLAKAEGVANAPTVPSK